MIDIVFTRATGRTSSEDTTRSNGKINGNVNINSFSLPLQWTEIRRCLYSGLLTGDISKREDVVSASVFEKFDSTRNVFYNATVYTFPSFPDVLNLGKTPEK